MCVWNRSLLWSDVILAIVINTSATLLSGHGLEASLWYLETCTAFGTNVLMQLLVPVPAAAAVLARPFQGFSGGWMAEVFFENLCYVSVISLVMAMTQAGISEQLLPLWLSTYGWLVAIGYATSLVLVGWSRMHLEKGCIQPDVES